ncbi:hypothetical protein I3843_Q053700 [Carya illinoinensis]|nr:hypothetical protein I3843_Q053700 [Carya illinoinensis]
MTSTDHCDYLVLKAEDASFRDLVFILFNLEPSQASIEFSEPCQKNAYKPLGDFWQRWYICVSLFLQKLLIIFGTPMALSGEMLEWWLESSVICAGDKVVVLKKSSSTFASVVGHLDQRVKLDENIKPTDKKYKKSLSMMACKLSYENEAFVQTIIKNQWNMENLGFYKFQNGTHNLYPNLIMVAFTGTKPFDPVGWQTDLDLSWFQLAGVGKAWLLEKLEGVYTFGQPRVGNKQFVDHMDKEFKKYDVKYYRYVYCNDLVPRYSLKKEPNENYLSLLWVIPKYLNAFWEVIRSFIIPCLWGPNYSETWLMRMFRVIIGLIIPGVPAHLLKIMLILNPTAARWLDLDQLILRWLNGSLSDAPLSQIINLKLLTMLGNPYVWGF